MQGGLIELRCEGKGQSLESESGVTPRRAQVGHGHDYTEVIATCPNSSRNLQVDSSTKCGHPDVATGQTSLRPRLLS